MGRRRPRADRVQERAADRPRDRPLRRPADLQLRLAGRRHARRDHARDPRRGPRLEHADADQHPARARRRPAGLRARAERHRRRREKLSKRHGAVALDDFRAEGYLPAALFNFLALLGWSYDDKTTIMSRHELVERFSLERVVPSPATFDYKKLDWMNGVVPARAAAGRVRALPLQWLRSRASTGRRTRVHATAPLVQEKIEKFSQYPDFVRFLFEDVSPDGADPTICARRARAPASRSSRGRRPRLEEALRALADELGEKPRKAFAPIRLAVTGSKVSPGLFESLELLGRDEVARAPAAPLAPARLSERPRRRERVERPLERSARPRGDSCSGRAREPARLIDFVAGSTPTGVRARFTISKDETTAERLLVTAGRRGTDAQTASMPAAQTGQSPIVAPATNATRAAEREQERERAAARSVAVARPRRPARRAPAARARSRASRTRKSAPRHSCSSGSTPAAPQIDDGLGDLGGRVARAAERVRELGVRRLGAGGRREAVRVLAREVQRVLQPPQRPSTRLRRRAAPGRRRPRRAASSVRASPVQSSPIASGVPLVGPGRSTPRTSDRNRYASRSDGCAQAHRARRRRRRRRFGCSAGSTSSSRASRSREAATLAEARAARRRASGPTSSCSTCTSAARRARDLLERAARRRASRSRS